MDSIRVSEAPDSSSILDEATKSLIRPISGLLRLGVFRFRTCVSGERAAKGDKAELSSFDIFFTGQQCFLIDKIIFDK